MLIIQNKIDQEQITTLYLVYCKRDMNDISFINEVEDKIKRNDINKSFTNYPEPNVKADLFHKSLIKIKEINPNIIFTQKEYFNSVFNIYVSENKNEPFNIINSPDLKNSRDYIPNDFKIKEINKREDEKILLKDIELFINTEVIDPYLYSLEEFCN